MKKLITAIFCLAALQAIGQEQEPVTEEKTSAWIKVTPPAAARKTSTVQKKPAAPKSQTTSKAETPKVFNQTNSKVNRFKKDKKG